jgi:hypothetical protein
MMIGFVMAIVLITSIVCVTRLDDQMLAIIERIASKAIRSGGVTLLLVNDLLPFKLSQTAPESIFDFIFDGVSATFNEMDAGIADGKKLILAFKGFLLRYWEEEIWIMLSTLGFLEKWSVPKCDHFASP